MNQKHKKQIIKIIISFIFTLISIIIKFNYEIINILLFILAYLIVGYDVLLKAFRNILRGKIFDENFLMSLATIGASLIGELEEAVAVMLFYQIGELFQSYAVNKSRKSISNLMDIKPDYANLLTLKETKKVNPEEINIGEIILVKPGEKIPLDGIVIEGESFLNTVAITGESVPRKIKVNDEVLSGYINIDSILKIKVTKKFEESTVCKILNLVENASTKKSKSENFISKFARIYTPIVVLIALLLALIPPIIFKNQIFSDWIYKSLSFLVVSCPCALVISIPLSFFSGLGASSKIGVLIKGSNYLEALSNTEIIVCDKTGTLTEGVFTVQKINALEYSEKELLKFATYAENYSNHPIAISLKEYYGKEIDEKLITKTKEISGCGIKSQIDGKTVLVGNEKLMKENNIKFNECNDIGTIIYIAINNKFAGTILISDKIKTDSYKAIKLFKNLKLKNIMLTGDHDNISKYVFNELNLDEYYAELLPIDKVNIVEQLITKKSSKGKLVFIGDGINDAPVLALSDIGIAMGAIGSDAAIEASDIVIMNDMPSCLASAIKISKKTVRIAKENIIFAIIIKISVLILSVLGLTTMWAAVFADVGVTIISILNSLRVLRIKNGEINEKTNTKN